MMGGHLWQDWCLSEWAGSGCECAAALVACLSRTEGPLGLPTILTSLCECMWLAACMHALRAFAPFDTRPPFCNATSPPLLHPVHPLLGRRPHPVRMRPPNLASHLNPKPPLPCAWPTHSAATSAPNRSAAVFIGDAYEDHFLLPGDLVLLITTRRLVLLEAPGAHSTVHRVWARVFEALWVACVHAHVPAGVQVRGVVGAREGVRMDTGVSGWMGECRCARECRKGLRWCCAPQHWWVLVSSELCMAYAAKPHPARSPRNLQLLSVDKSVPDAQGYFAWHAAGATCTACTSAPVGAGSCPNQILN